MSVTSEMRIGDLADQVGVNPKTIRYYEDIAVIPPAERTPAGHRVYRDEDVERLRFIRTAQRLGFTLDQIREVLAFRDRSDQPCAYVRDVLAEKVAELGSHISEMQDLRDQLTRLQRQVDELDHDDAYCCAVIEHHERARSVAPTP